MCGLVSIFGYGNDAPPVDACELRLIRDAMVDRGPDGSGLWISRDRRLGLAHRRLSLLDLSEAGAQPMASLDGHLQIVFNGEIYNHRELRSRLKARGCCFVSHSDTEVLLHLYAEKDVEMVRDLRGMYAFVIWDQRRRRLFAARDPIGIKPLYYADNGRSLRIASQVKALMCGGAIETERDPAGEVGFLLWGYVPDPFTTLRAVRALPAGAMMVAEQGRRPIIQTFCDLREELALAAVTNDTPATALAIRERIHTTLAKSVACHLIADVPVGIFQSAGLDSSAVTALASETPNTRLNTITLGFEEYRGTADDETPLAAQVSQQYGTQHCTRWLARDEFEADLERVIAAMDQPTTDGVNTYFVAQAAHQIGLKAALSGVGGDELFGGYSSFRQVPALAAAAWGRMVPRFVSRRLRASLAPAVGRITSPKYASLLEFAGTYGGAYLLRRALFMPWEIAKLLPPETVRAGLEVLQPELELDHAVRDIASPFLKVSALELTCYMRNQLLRDADWAGMAHSLEIRTPFADLEVLRAIAPLAARNLLQAKKRDLINLPACPFPLPLINRAKTGFRIPVQDWIAKGDRVHHERGLRGWARRLAGEFGFALAHHRSARRRSFD
ncbi:MAG TPA: asparagine synthase (glutamine-hydrolyzing) [Candidatus Binataceae bacterium]|nr:asparagine synthase (glutamine-hydrolyzing) [Candidatus Binataceae bacterium]